MIKKNFSGLIDKYPVLVVLTSQIITLILLRNIFLLTKIALSPWTFVFILSLVCTLLNRILYKFPYWFLIISFFLPILFYFCFHYLNISSGVYGVLFVIVALTFSNTLSDRVPLYLTNSHTHHALTKIVQKLNAKTFLDIGCGYGGVVRAIAPYVQISSGVESAPLSWLIAKSLSLINRKGDIIRDNFWRIKLFEYDIVYTFLSPAVMDEVYTKAKTEMRSGSYLISNSFPVLGIKEDERIVLNDRRKTQLFIYRI